MDSKWLPLGCYLSFGASCSPVKVRNHSAGGRIHRRVIQDGTLPEPSINTHTHTEANILGFAEVYFVGQKCRVSQFGECSIVLGVSILSLLATWPERSLWAFLGVLIHLVGSLITRDPGGGSLAWGDHNYKRCGGNGHLRSFSRAYLSSLLRSCWLRAFLFSTEVCT